MRQEVYEGRSTEARSRSILRQDGPRWKTSKMLNLQSLIQAIIYESDKRFIREEHLKQDVSQ